MESSEKQGMKASFMPGLALFLPGIFVRSVC